MMNYLLAALMLQKLPEKYMPMRFTFESNNVALTVDAKVCAGPSAAEPSSDLLYQENTRNCSEKRTKEDREVF